jgi:hypothetical protein
MFEYLAQAQSAVRRINDRINTLSKKLGSDSDIVNNLASRIEVLFPDNIRYKNGIPQLYQPSSLYKDVEYNTDLETFDKEFKTWGMYKKEYENRYKKYQEEQEFFRKEPVTQAEFIQQQERLPQALVYMYSSNTEEASKAIEIMRTKYRRKTYDELNNATELAMSGMRNTLTEKANNYLTRNYRRR